MIVSHTCDKCNRFGPRTVHAHSHRRLVTKCQWGSWGLRGGKGAPLCPFQGSRSCTICRRVQRMM
eukprot:713909-Prorocentrum_minimum.AAC.1